jgi:hypothetical protein
MIVTRTLLAKTEPGLALICKTMGFVRADIWRRYGALGNMGKSASDIRAEITHSDIYSKLLVDGTIRAETTKDAVNDILLYKAAAAVKVRRAINARAKDDTERKSLYKALREDEWLQNSFLHRNVRKHFKHGVSHASNQFIVRSDKHSSAIVNGQLVITIRIAKKYGDDIKLITTTSGKNVKLSKSNLRIIVKGDVTEIHYATEKAPGRACGSRIIGIDKGYTEAFMDSDGEAHGVHFGEVLTRYSDKTAATNQSRNKLHALEKGHRAAGAIAKADRILLNNLGRIKIDARSKRAQQELRTIAYQSMHSIVDKAGTVVSEDLTSEIAKRQNWKRYNRRMGSWAKGVLAQASEEVTKQRKANHILVNSAYTSQMDSTSGLLEGKRVGDKFYRENGDVLQADHNAALNVLARLNDSEISRFTPYREVRRILLARGGMDTRPEHPPAPLSVNRLELSKFGSPKAHKPSADKFVNTFEYVL